MAPGAVQADLTRITRLALDGTPVVGDKNCFYSDELVEASWGTTYTEPDAISQPAASGKQVVFWQPPPAVQGLAMEAIKWCTPDPDVLGFMGGATVLTTGAVGSETSIGFAAPEVGQPASAFPVSFELWSKAVIGGQLVGYWHWLMPMIYPKFSENFVANGSDATLPDFSATGSQNTNWGEGPKNDWPYTISHRVFQAVLETSLPVYENGYTEVLAPTP